MWLPLFQIIQITWNRLSHNENDFSAIQKDDKQLAAVN